MSSSDRFTLVTKSDRRKMSGSQGTKDCPNDPFLQKKGLRGCKMALLDAKLFQAQEVYKWMINVNTVIISCKQEITPDNVRAALKMLCRRHPHLRMKVVTGESTSDRYVAFFDTDPEPDLEVLETDDWVKTCEAEFERTFQEDGLQWRVKMLKATKDPDSERLRYTFVFSYNHAMVDGGSIMAGIHTNFHHYLEDVVCGKAKVVESLGLLPGIDTMFPETVPSRLDKLIYKVKELFKGPMFTFDPMAAELLKAIQPEKDAQVRCNKLIPMDFSVEETARIIKKCREHGIKVNGYVSAVAAIATGNLLRKYTKNPKLKKELTFDLSTLLNLRRLHKPPIAPEQVGTLIAFLPVSVTVADDGTNRDAFWELAKICHEDVHAFIDGGLPTEPSKVLNYCLEAEGFFKMLAEAENPHIAYYMTNRGNFEVKSQYPDDDGACTFEANYWTCAEQEFNFDVFVHQIESINGHMMWILSYYGHKCSDEIAKEYFENIRDITLKMSSE